MSPSPAAEVYYEPARPLDSTRPGCRSGAVAGPGRARHRRRDRRRVLQTGVPGPDRACAPRTPRRALEVMSRFAIDPRWLIYLPPTMSPVATARASPVCSSTRRRPSRRIRADGVPAVVCEEKHMGSRAVALVCRDLDAARARFGAPGDALGAVWTRTGRSFFAPDAHRRAGRPAARRPPSGPGCSTSSARAGCCSTPSCCRGAPRPSELLRNQYAAVGAAATRGAAGRVGCARQPPRPAASTWPSSRRGPRSRLANAERFRDAYRRYCWPTDGLRRRPARPVPAAGHRRPRRMHDRPHAVAPAIWPTGWSPPTLSCSRPPGGRPSTSPTRPRSAAGDRAGGRR